MTNKNKKTFAIVVMSFLVLIFGASLSLFCYQRAYAGKILKNVYYNNLDLSGKTKTQAATIIDSQAGSLVGNQFTTAADNGKTYEATYSQTGIAPDIDNTVAEAFAYGRDPNFFRTLLGLSETFAKKRDVELKVAFDEDAWNAYLASTQDALSLPPVDASLSIKNGSVVTNTGQNGQTIDASKLKLEIESQFVNHSDNATVEVPTTPVTPTLLSENLSQARTTAENYLKHSLSLTYLGQTYNIDPATLSSWIAFGLQNGKYSAWLNTGAVKAYLSKIAAKSDVTVIDKKISAVDNATVLQEGRQGLYLDQDDAVSKISASLGSATLVSTIAMVQTTKDFKTITVFPDEGIIPGRFPGKYIDIDLTKQLLTLFDGTTQVGQYVVSSGKASTPTPVGTRTIQGHNPKAWSAPYGLYMPWWMSMGGGYGIHELPEWPNGYKEGENHLGTPVSHGCVRLGIGPAEFVYNWTPDGTPVYIHK